MEAYGDPEGQQIFKIRAKYCKSIDPKTQQKKITIQDPPKPQKVLFYYSETHVFKDPPQNRPNDLQRALQGLPKDEQKTNTKKDTKMNLS